MATAHGYGRKKKLPNNRDSKVLTFELDTRGIKMFDTVIRSHIDKAATTKAVVTDVSGPLMIRKMPNDGPVDEAKTYRGFPPGALIRFLTHPGNYNIRRPLCLGLRTNRN
jgi:hypothetical protein